MLLDPRLAFAGAAGPSGALVLGSGDDAVDHAFPRRDRDQRRRAGRGRPLPDPAIQARQVGHKALAAALSDLAAMGAAPGEAYVQLGIPDERGDAELLGLADGLAALAARYGVAVAGGDVTRAPALLVAVTVVGSRRRRRIALVRRSGAAPGDVARGHRRARRGGRGPALLERPELDEGLDATVAAALRARQLEPEPRLAAGLALAEAGATAMIDISDGLGGRRRAPGDGGRGRDRDRADAAPASRRGSRSCRGGAGVDPLDLAAAGGEDYELLAALAPEERRPGAGARAADAASR